MKKNKNKLTTSIHIILSVCAAFGWWGLLYPELTMTPSTYKVVYEDQSIQAEDKVEWDFDDDIYWKILGSDRGRIRFKSRLFTNISVLQGQGRDIHESGK